jgi:hypothetical protein
MFPSIHLAHHSFLAINPGNGYSSASIISRYSKTDSYFQRYKALYLSELARPSTESRSERNRRSRSKLSATNPSRRLLVLPVGASPYGSIEIFMKEKNSCLVSLEERRDLIKVGGAALRDARTKKAFS